MLYKYNIKITLILYFSKYWSYKFKSSLTELIIGGGQLSTKLIPFDSDVDIKNTDGTITAAVKFKDNYYFAGSFSQFEGTTLNGLAMTDGKILSNIKEQELNLEISSSFRQLKITGALDDQGTLAIISNGSAICGVEFY